MTQQRVLGQGVGRHVAPRAGGGRHGRHGLPGPPAPGGPGFALAWLLAAGLAAALPSTALSQTNAPPAASPDALVSVRAFKVDGNTLLDAALLQSTLQPWLGERSLADLRQAAQAVQGLYGRAGYGAVVAYLPPQPLTDGTLTIAVVEGKVGRVSVQGVQRLSPARLRAALPSLVEGRTPQLRRIDAELQMANENPSRTVGVLLRPGSAPGEVEATVKVEEQALHHFSLGLDNSGNQRTGDYRLSLGWQHADLSGHDDVLNLQLQTSPTQSSAVSVISAGYRLPLVRQLAALELFAAYSDVDGGSQALPGSGGDLRFSGKGRIAGARGVWYLPRQGEYDQRLTSGLEYRAYLNDCGVNGLPSGACGSAGQSVSVQPLTLEYAVQTGGSSPAMLSVGLAHNLAVGGRHSAAADFEAVRPGAARRYTVLRLQGQIARPVLEDWQLAARAALQYSPDRLVPGEQFGLGGAGSVRGYQERELAADTGLSASLELISPRLALAGPTVDLRWLVFADAGRISNNGDLACRALQTSCSLSAWGLGARLGWRTLQLRLSVAQARQDASTTQAGHWRAHAALNASF